MAANAMSLVLASASTCTRVLVLGVPLYGAVLIAFR